MSAVRTRTGTSQSCGPDSSLRAPGPDPRIGEFQDGHKKNRGLTKADPGLHEFRARIARISPNARRSLLIQCPLCA